MSDLVESTCTLLENREGRGVGVAGGVSGALGVHVVESVVGVVIALQGGGRAD